MTTTNTQTPNLANDDDLIPRFSASGQPVRKSYRFAFTMWVIFFLLVIAFTLFQFIMTWVGRRIVN